MIEVRSLSRYYGDFAAVEDIAFQINSNEVVGFLGLNGAGKSTTLKILAGLLAPSDGEIEIDGVNMDSAAASFKSRIGFLPEELPLYQEMTVTEFLLFLGGLRGVSKQELMKTIPGTLEQCQLKGKAHSVIGELSLGYRKRVGIAQAIIHSPTLVILDEPISGLDPYQRVEMREVIRGLSKNATVLLSSHNLKEISETCDRILMLDRGKIIAQGSTEELMARIGESGVALEARIVPGDKDLAETLNGISIIKAHKTIEEGSDSVLVKIQIEGKKPEALSAELVKAGLGLRSMGSTTDSLEAIFLSLTQGGEA